MTVFARVFSDGPFLNATNYLALGARNRDRLPTPARPAPPDLTETHVPRRETRGGPTRHLTGPVEPCVIRRDSRSASLPDYRPQRGGNDTSRTQDQPTRVMEDPGRQRCARLSPRQAATPITTFCMLTFDRLGRGCRLRPCELAGKLSDFRLPENVYDNAVV